MFQERQCSVAKESDVIVAHKCHKIHGVADKQRQEIILGNDRDKEELENIQHQHNWHKAVAMHVKTIGPFHRLLQKVTSLHPQESIGEEPGQAHTHTHTPR